MSQPRQKPHRSKQDYKTPENFINAVKDRLRIVAFNYDYAADVYNHQAHEWYDEQFNALSRPASEWAYYSKLGWGWLNPPYTKIGPWAAKCLETVQAGGRIVFLIPASVGSNWYRDYIHGQYGVEVLFLNGRLAFIPDKPTWLYPKDLMLVLFGTGKPFAIDVWNWREII